MLISKNVAICFYTMHKINETNHNAAASFRHMLCKLCQQELLTQLIKHHGCSGHMGSGYVQYHKGTDVLCSCLATQDMLPSSQLPG